MDQSFGPNNREVPNDRWKESLQSLSFRWTDAAFVKSSEIAELNFHQLQTSFQELLELRQGELSEAYAACKKIVERTCSGNDELLEQVSLSLDLGLLTHLVEGSVKDLLIIHQFRVVQGVLPSYYEHLRNTEELFNGTVKHPFIRSQEKNLRVQEMLHSLGSKMDETVEKIELLKEDLLSRWPVLWENVEEEMLEKLEEISPGRREHFEELMGVVERYGASLLPEEVEGLTEFHVSGMEKHTSKLHEAMTRFLSRPKGGFFGW